MDTRERRLAENERLFREVNERIEQAARRQGSDDHRYDFVCECANIDCGKQVTMPLAEYEGVRADPVAFLVSPGHEMPDIEDVVGGGWGYNVVRKHGEAAQVAREEDPRAR